MSRVCDLTGKKAMTGNNVSFSLNRTKRKFDVNLVKKRALKDINRKGISAALKEAKDKGFIK